MVRKVVLMTALLALGACGGTPKVAISPSVELADANALPLPTSPGGAGDYVYTIGALDKISIEVDGMPELRREVVVDGQGMISYPLAGSVSAEGLTAPQLARALEVAMRESYVRDPRVNVNIVEPVSQVITVDGQVNRPGLYPVYRDMTLSQAVAMAEGEGEFARTSAVMIFRTVQGQQYVGLYDLDAIRFGNYADPRVFPSDRVVVSESQTRRFLQLMGPFVSLVTTPLIYLIRNN